MQDAAIFVDSEHTDLDGFGEEMRDVLELPFERVLLPADDVHYFWARYDDDAPSVRVVLYEADTECVAGEEEDTLLDVSTYAYQVATDGHGERVYEAAIALFHKLAAVARWRLIHTNEWVFEGLQFDPSGGAARTHEEKRRDWERLYRRIAADDNVSDFAIRWTIPVVRQALHRVGGMHRPVCVVSLDSPLARSHAAHAVGPVVDVMGDTRTEVFVLEWSHAEQLVRGLSPGALEFVRSVPSLASGAETLGLVCHPTRTDAYFVERAPDGDPIILGDGTDRVDAAR